MNLSIDDFYKVYGYCCFYKSQVIKQNGVKIEELTITFVSYHYPREFLKHLREKQGIQVEIYDKGIYYLIGDIISMQVIVTSELSEEQNLWLKHLSNRLKYEQAANLVKEYKKYQNEPLHKFIMELIVRANKETFREAKKMCDALMELFKEEFKERESIALQQGIEQGIEIIICNALRNGHTPEQVSVFIGISLEEVLQVQMSMKQDN